MKHISNLKSAMYSFTEDESTSNTKYKSNSSIINCDISISKIPSLKDAISTNNRNTSTYKSTIKKNISEPFIEKTKRTKSTSRKKRKHDFLYN